MSTKVLPGHGSGGRLMHDLIERSIREILGREFVQLDDSAVLNLDADRIAFTTDTFTVTPLEFPGGTIGSLAVNGTVNDLAVMGAQPMYLSCALILEEGLEIERLRNILVSMREAADYAGVRIVTGDTKVVERGKGDKIFINTSGIGIMRNELVRREIRPGDAVIINGHIGDHGIAVMALRNGLSFSSGLKSDCAPMNHLINRVLEAHSSDVKFMRDPTRGGVASVLNEIVNNRPLGIELDEESLPVRDEVRGVCEILGIDPLYAANEGKVIMVVSQESADGIIEVMKATREASHPAVIGRVTEEFPGKSYIKTAVGGKRILPILTEEQLPRIC